MAIKSIEVTRTNTYSPDYYIEYCKKSYEIPTQEGFLEFIRDYIDDDFEGGHGVEDICKLD